MVCISVHILVCTASASTLYTVCFAAVAPTTAASSSISSSSGVCPASSNSSVAFAAHSCSSSNTMSSLLLLKLPFAHTHTWASRYLLGVCGQLTPLSARLGDCRLHIGALSDSVLTQVLHEPCIARLPRAGGVCYKREGG